MLPCQLALDPPVYVVSSELLPARVLILSSMLNRPEVMASIQSMAKLSSGAWPIQFHPIRSTTSSTGSWGRPVCVRVAGPFPE